MVPGAGIETRTRFAGKRDVWRATSASPAGALSTIAEKDFLNLQRLAKSAFAQFAVLFEA
jgi:hypothetical protein